MMSNSFRDNIHRVSIVEKPGIGTNSFHVRNNTFRDMDRAQSHKEAAGSLRLLTDHAMFERNTFIKIARLKTTRSKTSQNSITPLQTFTPVGSNCHSDIQTSGTCHFLSNGLNDAQAIFVKVN